MSSSDTPLRVVVLISGNGSNLQAILDASNQPEANYRVVAVISNRADAYGLQRAEQAEIPTEILNSRTYDDRESYDAALTEKIDTYSPGLIALAGFMRILTADFVRHYHGRMLNIHPSLLPKYKGLNTHQRVLDSADKVHGCSVHFVTEELDDGPIVMQTEVPILKGDTADTLQQRVHKQEHIIYPKCITLFANGKLTL